MREHTNWVSNQVSNYGKKYLEWAEDLSEIDLDALAEIVSEPNDVRYKRSITPKTKELKKTSNKNSIEFLLNLKNIL